MNRHDLDFVQRREVLKLQCAAQRLQLLDAVVGIQRELGAVDRVLGFIRNFKVSPTMIAGVASMVLGLGTGRATRLVGRGWLLFNTLQRVWGLIQNARAAKTRRPAARSAPVVSPARE